MRGLSWPVLRHFGMLFAAAAALLAQIGTSSLTGVVTDQSGAAVPNAGITLNGTDHTFTQKTVTESDGRYVLPALPPGHYRVEVSAAGFVSQETEPFELSSGQGGSLNLTVHVATQQTQVTVEATTPLLQTTSASVGATVSAQQLTQLPVLGRSFLNAISLEPGTVPVAPAGSTTSHSPVGQSVMPSVFGQRQKDNNFLMDGVDNRDPNLLGVALYPPPEAIAEMKIDSGVGSAAYGHASGATIDVVTKSGTNSWHGDAWEYFRNDALDARSFFAPKIGVFHWNQFGGDLGGPLTIPHILSKDKAWYVYGYYEGVRINNAANYTTNLPTPAELQGDFSAAGVFPIYDPYTTAAGSNGTFTRSPYPSNRIPQSEINSTAAKVAAGIYPAPNLAPGIVPGANYINTAGNVSDGNQWNARADHQFGSRDTFFARYTGASNPSYGVSLPSLQGTTRDRIDNVAVADTHSISPNFVVTGRYSFMGLNYFTGNVHPAGLADQTGLGAQFPAWEGMAMLPQISIQGYQGVNSNGALIGPIREQSGMGDAHWIKGGHTLDFGVAYVRTFVNLDQVSWNLGFARSQTSNFNSTTGDGLASFLLGTPFTATRQIGGTRGIMTGNAEGAYVQDTWRHRNLTINAGLRYDYTPMPVNHLGLGTFDFSTGVYRWDRTNPITGAAPNMRPGGVPTDAHDFAPRFGVAYSITPRLVVRSSGGIFFNSFSSNYIQVAQSERGNWPFDFPQTLNNLNATSVTTVMPNVFTVNPQGSSTPSACVQCLNIERSSSRTPYVTEWTFSLQYQLSHDLAVQASYFGSKGTKLTAQIIDNTAVYPGSTPIATRQIYPQFSPFVANGFNEFNSWYEGGALRVEKRFSHGLNYLVSYTYSKNIDQVDNLSNTYSFATSNPTRFNSGLNKGLAGFDLRHILVASLIWEVPGHTNHKLLDAVVSGWRLGNIFTFHSGLPYSIIVFQDYANIGGVGGRYPEYASLVGDPNAGAAHTPQAWFNTAAFTVPASYTYGTAGRNIMHTANLIGDDISLSKSWAIREHSSVELRGEFFNALNHPVFGYPDVFADDGPNFGTVGGTLNSGRQIQLAAKIHF